MPSLLQAEIRKNFSKFEAQWPTDLAAASAALEASKEAFAKSYIRITSIQAWRTSVIAGSVDEDSLAFFFEAQNDFLISHCLARSGSFRQALKSLRSAIENVFFSMYYKDHPVELEKWRDGRHKLGFTELSNYFESHPALNGKDKNETGLALIGGEYATLSKAVHGSAKGFRMTKNLIDIQLWSGDIPSVGRWASREKAVISGINLLLLHLFRDELQGVKHRNLRETLGLVLPKSAHSSIKNNLGVKLIVHE